jgi:hypothetical protein
MMQKKNYFVNKVKRRSCMKGRFILSSIVIAILICSFSGSNMSAFAQVEMKGSGKCPDGIKGVSSCPQGMSLVMDMENCRMKCVTRKEAQDETKKIKSSSQDRKGVR